LHSPVIRGRADFQHAAASQLLDLVSPECLAPVICAVVAGLVAGGDLAPHRTLDGHLLVALDSTP